MGSTQSSRKRPPLTRFMPHALIVFLVLLLFSGGASRPDEPHQILARLAAIALIAFAAISLQREQIAAVRVALGFLIAVAMLMIVQLIPLPPGLWGSLPGRAIYQEGFAIAGLDPVWRPLSLTPDRTINALLALLPPLAAVLGWAGLDRSQRRLVLLAMIIAVLLSALIGIVQLATGSGYLYLVTNTGSPVGLLANRNHQAALLASAFPMLAIWVSTRTADAGFERLRNVLALLAATLLVAMLLATGSRAGLGLGAVSAMLSLLLLWLSQRPSQGPGRRRQLIILLPVVLGLVAVAATFYFARDFALQRLTTESTDELRGTIRPIYTQMIGDFLPLGSGFGSFDPVFRTYEPFANLGPNYINHAHNDFAEILLEGGVAGGILVAVFLVWFTLRLVRLWTARGAEATDPAIMAGRAGSIVILLLLAGSAVDYPLRTPLLGVVFTVAALWMLPVRSSGASKRKLGTVGAIE